MAIELISISSSAHAEKSPEFQAMLTLAEQGNALAQFNIGFMYRQGRGVKQDYGEAVKWLKKASDQGLAPAQYNLGLMYRKGLGTQQDDSEAVKWYGKAAEQQYPLAQFNLGFMYRQGLGVGQDYLQAKKYFKLACDNGFQRGCKGYQEIDRHGK